MNQQVKKEEKVQNKWSHPERKKKKKKRRRKEFENEKDKTKKKFLVCINFITHAYLGIS